MLDYIEYYVTFQGMQYLDNPAMKINCEIVFYMWCKKIILETLKVNSIHNISIRDHMYVNLKKKYDICLIYIQS